ncbi:MAG TPA: alpha/beta hydrolase [Candidatus Limnocylindria bacterium]|nr:alpha/beta hydrolase [Candidatus Limnocylindria bacterium]
MSAGSRLHVEVEGSGTVVVLAHGFGGSARNFLPQARGLRDRYRIVRFDARGHARSEAPAEASAYTPEAFVADLGRVLDQVGARAAVVGGLSMGAGTALRFALAHPERVEGLVLAAFPPGAGAPGTFAAVAADFARAIEREGLEAAGARFVWGPASGLDPAAARLVRQGFLEHPPHGLAHTLRGVLAAQPSIDELAPRLAALARPALVIVGARDRMSLAPSRALAAVLPQAKLVVVEGAGHVVNLAQPAAFNRALEEFLAAAAGGG